MTLLNLEALKQRAAFAFVDVEVAELGGPVRLRDIAAGDRDRVVRFFHENKNDSGVSLKNWEFKVLLIALALCDESGARVVGDEDMSIIAGFGGAVVDGLYKSAAALNGLGETSRVDAEKNSGSILSSDSGTASPGTTDAASPS